MVHNEIMKINKYFIAFDWWAHILEPGQSTLYHSHEKLGFRDGISWVYYVNCTEKSGDIVLNVNALKRKLQLPRISVSGNYFPDNEKLNEFSKEIHEGRSNYFYYVGAYNN